MKEYYRNWSVLGNNSLLEKLVFRMRHKLKCYKDNFCLLGCDSAFEKFQQTIIDETNYYVPEKKSETIRHQKWIDNSIIKLAAKNQKL